MDKKHGKRVRRTQRRAEGKHTHRFTQRNAKKRFGKLQATMTYMDSGSKTSLSSMTD